MTRPYKVIDDGLVCGVAIGISGVESPQKELAAIAAAVAKKPTDTPTHTYKLKPDLTWEAVEVEPRVEGEEE